MEKFHRYKTAVNYIESLSNLPLDGDFMANNGNPEIYIKRMKYFLELLGRPDQGFKYIHITGTSGKGSVTNMIHCCLNASGKKVGSFVSPSVVTTIDKILVRTIKRTFLVQISKRKFYY
jgi:folylpolyglutamate synthase/dihydropteroate synthase